CASYCRAWRYWVAVAGPIIDIWRQSAMPASAASRRPASLAIRPAFRHEAAHLARLVNLAGEGLPLSFWGEIAEDWQDPWEIGYARAMRDSGGFSWRNAELCELDGEIAGLLITYTIESSEAADLEGVPAVFRPLVELEALA